jgi:hypothetical protein
MNGEHETEDTTRQALVIRSPGWLLLTGGLRLCGGMAVMAAAIAPGLGGGTPARVALVLTSAAVLVIAARTFLGGVYVKADGVLVRNPFRSWRLQWDEIEGVAPRPAGPLAGLMLRGGRQIPVCSWGWPSPDRREQLASLLWTARPGPETAR